jgi:hypothetical protein
VIPAGILLYPFENKKFGFQVKVTPIFPGGDTPTKGQLGHSLPFFKGIRKLRTSFLIFLSPYFNA